ncbi:MAG: type IV pilus twitching motility protein PilT [Candidatus Pacebacteria bacterium]|nr:type IV pilus twitching motility protein PilT [Candidatus Paceibacterota bacterium]
MTSINIKQELDSLLINTAQEGSSDLHLSVGRYPTLRIDGRLIPLTNKEILTPKKAKEIVYAFLDEKQKEKFERNKELDISYEFEGKIRFRVNIFYQRGYVSAAFRLITSKIRTLEELNIPSMVYDFTKPSQGFILVVGPSGHGKSTTLAALIDRINHQRYAHIVTIEDPIEYVYTQDRCIINQREVYSDTKSFNAALRSVFREDADVILVGEMRDSETISTAITAAETGHLVFATLHTNSAAQTVDRIIDSFHAGQQNQIRAQLAGNLLGILSQRLVPRIEGGRLPAVEIMIANSAVRNLIRENKNHQLDLVINTSVDEGMISLNSSLASLVKNGEISLENAEIYSTNINDLKMMMQK